MGSARALLGALVTASFVVWPSMPAQSHTQAIASWPAVGEVVTVAPDRVTVAYSTEVLPDIRVTVTGPDGGSVADGDPVAVGQVVTQALVAADAPGIYSATFEAIGDDGHPVTGSFEFTVDPGGVATGNPSGPEPDLGLDAEDETDDGSAEGTATDTADADSSSALLLTGLAGAAVLVIVLRLVVRRRRS